MSHNKIKVAGQEPNVSGEISVSLDNLSNVNITSIANDHVLQYDSSSSQWKNETVSAASTTAQYILIGQGETNDYNNSGASGLSANDYLYLYDTSPLNTLAGSTITKVSGQDWIESITLPAGKYQILMNFRVTFSTSGEFSFNIYDTTNTEQATGKATIGENLSDYSQSSTISSAYVLSAQAVLRPRVSSASGVNAVNAQGNTPSEFSSLYIEKIG